MRKRVSVRNKNSLKLIDSLQNMVRSILLVMNEISMEIPTWYDPEKRAALEKTFTALRRQWPTLAPELLPNMWIDLCMACEAYLPDPLDPDAPWATRVAAILSDSKNPESPSPPHF